MKKTAVVLMLLLMCSLALSAQQGTADSSKRTPASVLDRGLSQVEQEFVGAADAMPENQYAYAPTQGEFKGVRTFAQQVKHVAAVNYLVAASILGEKPPVDTGSENGPDAVKSKADISKFLKDSFAYAHKAVGTITDANLVESIKNPFGEGQATRLGMATLIIGHCFDHYGQMVEYLRSNNIVPPASRGQ